MCYITKTSVLIYYINNPFFKHPQLGRSISGSGADKLVYEGQILMCSNFHERHGFCAPCAILDRHFVKKEEVKLQSRSTSLTN